jgi:hypothetical protein
MDYRPDSSGRGLSAHRTWREPIAQKVGIMEQRTLSLCPSCIACPEVEIGRDTVTIGETGNLVVLKKDEWNELVKLIQTGQLSAL